MLLPNFDRAFERHVTQWMQDNSARLGGNMDRMEQEMPSLYLKWIEAPADFLDGKSPLSYFASFEDAAHLVRWMVAYVQGGVPLPDLLLERIVELGEASEAPLLALLSDSDAPEDAVLHAMSLLRQLESTAPLPLYIAWVRDAEREEDSRTELAADMLTSFLKEVEPALLEALPDATPTGEALLLDILSNAPGHEVVLERMLRRFSEDTTRRALFAGYLGKLGDERALSELLRVAELPETNYLDFIEIASAIERLGGEPPAPRDFEGDPYYESLKRVTP